jgi:hypothetical protein
MSLSVLVRGEQLTDDSLYSTINTKDNQRYFNTTLISNNASFYCMNFATILGHIQVDMLGAPKRLHQ